MAKKNRKEDVTIARVTEIISASPVSFEDAARRGIGRAMKRLRDVRGAWIKEMKVDIDKGKITAYRVAMMVTFVLED
jgi:flavin-binding protein dodecin